MKGTTKAVLGFTLTLVLAFLLLTHATGASRVIASLGSGYVSAVKTLQGR